MSQAVFEVEHAGPSVSLQDKGRFGYMRFGVTESGPMDRIGYQIACEAVNAKGPGIEVSLGGLTLRCKSGDVSVAVAGGNFGVMLDGQQQPPWSVFTVHAGSKLQVRSGGWGSWCYIAFAGEVDGPEWLGSQSTHMDTGLCGIPFQQGDLIKVNAARLIPDRNGEIANANGLKPSKTVRVVMGPQDRFFTEQSI
jgi:allophanate hydrolase